MGARTRIIGAMATLVLLSSQTLQAQWAPTKPVAWVTNSAGGAPEAVQRALIDRVAANTGVTLVFESRPGGAGAPALQAIKRASNDGYTIGVTYASAIALNPYVQPGLDVDPLRDFTPITNMMGLAVIISAREDFPAKSFNELIAMAKTKPETVKFGYAGAGNLAWLSLIEDRLGAKFIQVQFKTSNEATTLALGGHIDVYFDVIGTLLAQKGRIKALAFGGATPSPQLPGVPLVRDTLTGVDFASWFAVVGPAGMQPDRVAWFNRELVRALRHPQVTTIITNGGMEPIANTAEEFGAALRREVDANRDIVRKFNIRS